MNRAELLTALAEAEKDYADAKKVVAQCKKQCIDAETKLIEAKLNKEKLEEALRIDKNTVPSLTPEMSAREKEIEQFRQNNPEVVEFARQRDAKRGEKE